MSYHKVLVAFDGSKGSIKALRHAIDYVKNNAGTLTVVHAAKIEKHVGGLDYVPPANSVLMSAGNGINQMAPKSTNADAERMERPALTAEQRQDQLWEKGEEVFKDARAVLDKEGIQADFEVLEGEAAEEIDRYALNSKSDLIVIGSRGLGGLKKLVLGSVSQKVVQKASCPVLVVK